MGMVVKPDLEGDFGYRKACFTQRIFGLVHAQAQKVRQNSRSSPKSRSDHFNLTIYYLSCADNERQE